jgi:hypothetical protein
MKVVTTAVWAILIGILLSVCSGCTFDPDNKPAYGQSNGKKSDR